VNSVLIGLLGALLATNQPAAVSNLVENTTGISVPVETTDPVEKEYKELLAADDAAHEEIDRWVKDAQAFDEKGAGNPNSTLKQRVLQRRDLVRKAYENFFEKHPKHARARLAYGSFLYEQFDEEEGVKQWDIARELDPKNPAGWNNLANHYGHRGPVKKAFEYYAKAIELDPNESVYYFNFATTVYLFRTDAMDFYKFTESQVFDKALELYRLAMKYDPANFILASDYANSFYGTKPPRLKEGLKAWENALKLAGDDVEREGVFIHFARINMLLGNLDESRRHLDAITNQEYAELKRTLTKRINGLEAESKTNKISTPATSEESKR
jgi:tetratricopeptide (TPR) repeat protein